MIAAFLLLGAMWYGSTVYNAADHELKPKPIAHCKGAALLSRDLSPNGLYDPTTQIYTLDSGEPCTF